MKHLETAQRQRNREFLHTIDTVINTTTTRPLSGVRLVLISAFQEVVDFKVVRTRRNL